jgi:diamine N-acetyltransferase
VSDDLSITLREITGETVRDIMRLEVTENQKAFVATNAVSIAQAYFEPKAWFRAVYAGDDPVGFVMLYEDPGKPEWFLWRFMIDHRYQGKGYGRLALEQVIGRLRGLGAAELLTSYVPGDGSPGGFYHHLGFVDTGEEDDGELVTRLVL